MRSEYVFAAVNEIGNRYLLCRVASASARRLHRDSTQASETINRSLRLIATGEPEESEQGLSSGSRPAAVHAATASS